MIDENVIKIINDEMKSTGDENLIRLVVKKRSEWPDWSLKAVEQSTSYMSVTTHQPSWYRNSRTETLPSRAHCFE